MTQTTQSPAFNYVRNQYLLGKFNEQDLTVLVGRGIITEEEKEKIINGQY